jgi:hypothetical protein
MKFWMILASVATMTVLSGCTEALIAGGTIAADEVVEEEL